MIDTIHKLLQSSNTEDISIGIELLKAQDDKIINEVITYYRRRREDLGGFLSWPPGMNPFPMRRIYRSLLNEFDEIDYVFFKRYKPKKILIVGG